MDEAQEDQSQWRDVGPFRDADQAMKQFANWTANWNPLVDEKTRANMQVAEVVLGLGVTATRFERRYLAEHGIDPILSTIICGWLIRTARAAAR